MTVMIEIKVIPNSGKQKLELDKSETIKCYLKKPPEKGKANAELIKFISKKLSVTQDSVSIARGATSRKKTIRINSEMKHEEILIKLGIETQTKIM